MSGFFYECRGVQQNIFTFNTTKHYEVDNKSKLSIRIKNTSLVVLAIFGLLAFIFALLSGAETDGSGISGIITNSPNTLPWAALLILAYIGWRWPLIGGICITLLGFGLLYFFGIFDDTPDIIPLIVGLIPVLFGGLLIFSWGLNKRPGIKS